MLYVDEPILYTKELILVDQLLKLNNLLIEVLVSNPFYSSKLTDIKLPVTSIEQFTRTFPFSSKAELSEDQKLNPPFGTNLTHPIEEYVRFCQTSGTSGSPITWLDTEESWSWMVDNWVQVLRASGITRQDRIFFAFSFGPFLGFWTAFEAGVREGCLCLPGGGMSTSARLQSIIQNGVTALCCTPTYAIRLGEVAQVEGIDLSTANVKRILVAGEPGAGIPETRSRIERLWPQSKVWDHHGMTEVGPVSFECPANPGVLHIMEGAFIPEVIHPETLLPVQSGEKGELVLTNLGRIGSPLLRYRTGDLVQASTSPICSCGRSDMALMGGILGRTDDMIVVRGVNLYPSAVESVVRQLPEIAEYRVLISNQRGLSEVEIEIETFSGTIGTELENRLRVAFNLRIPVRVVEPESLPRFELKAKRWVRV